MILTTRPKTLIRTLHETIIGQAPIVESLVLALIAGGHLVLEGPPGLAKTLACRALAAALGGQFKRIQFTPDLLPSDIVGTRVFNQRDATFSTSLGPIFANIVLADEINRAPAKVQSALLEAMQERQVTIGLETHALPRPFTVLATMNPLDADGTYALPLAQTDRFLMKVRVGYPSKDEEIAILERFGGAEPPFPLNVASLADVLLWQDEARGIHVEPKVRAYIVDLVAATRVPHPIIEHGASPRASLALIALARARALIDARTYVTPDDVRAVAPSALRHRIGYGYRIATEKIDPEDVLLTLIAGVPAP